ncbi:hypothetical protein DTO169E5_1865 [Paecilomyces variotii]|nr:hypothetical protein DTO169E5_1865 [Paecilomyces variotii]KAJ9378947.1 hypothetical protein DTO063F5_7392 [Paecilomyces variotii]
MENIKEGERIEYGSRSTCTTDVIRRLLDSNKAVAFQKWEQLWHLLDTIEAQIDLSMTPVTEPLHHVLARLVEETRLLCHEKLQDKQAHPGNPEPVMEFIQRLSQLKEIKDMYIGQDSPQNPQFLASYDRWTREKLQERWTERYARSQERAVLRERERHAQMEQNHGALQAILDEKRGLQRRVFQDCVTEQLYEIQELHDQTVAAATQELNETIILYTHQLGILLEEDVTPSDAVSDVIDTRINIAETLVSVLETIQVKTNTLDVVLDSMGQRMRKMLMRIDRLNAGDVQSGPDREWEQQRRLVRPEAIRYILKAAQDAEDICSKAKDANKAITVIDGHLARMLGHAKDRWRPLEMQTYLAWTLLESRQTASDRTDLTDPILSL